MPNGRIYEALLDGLPEECRKCSVAELKAFDLANFVLAGITSIEDAKSELNETVYNSCNVRLKEALPSADDL